MNLDLKKNKSELLFLPLGGANEIGMNLNLYQLDGKWLMVDCGVGFANDVPGITMMTPDITFIKKHRKDLLGIVLTHIHEDHLGAIQYLIQDLEVPIYATLLGANFLKSKLSEFNLDKTTDIRIIDGEKNLNLGPFDIEFLGLTHSVPEMKAMMIRTRVGNVLHTGDWKFDPDPVVGDVSDKELIKKYGDAGEILALVCDSTNAINEGHSKSEGELYESIKSLVKDRKGYVAVTTFASNIARIHTIAKIAADCGRKVVLAGWSLHRIHEVARKSGYFTGESFAESNFISDRELKFYPKNEVLIISTGCQGEPRAATRKIAAGKHPTIKFTKGDLVIFSSKIIPGNEKKIFELFSALAQKDIEFFTEKDHFVHVSGHPSQDELREMYALAKPKLAIPVHGEFIHTKVHSELALESGVQKAIATENGTAIKINGEDVERSQKVGSVQSGYLGVDGFQLVDLNSELVRQRRKIAETGIVTISLTLDESLKAASKPRITCVGCYDISSDRDATDFVLEEMAMIIQAKTKEFDIKPTKKGLFAKSKKAKKKNGDAKIIANIEKTIRSRVLKILENIMGKRPALEVIVHKV